MYSGAIGVLIKELEIKGFRGIRRLAKPLRLEKLNVLIGRNNAGKTSILEALFLLAEPYAEKGSIETPRERLYAALYVNGSVRAVSPATYIAMLHGRQDPSRLVYGYTGTAVITYRLYSGRTVMIRIERGARKNPVISNSAYALVEELMKEQEERVPALYLPDTTVFYDKLKEALVNEETWSIIEDMGYNVTVIKDLYVDSLPDRYTEATVRWSKLHLRKEVAGKAAPLYIDVDSLGEGVRRTLLVYLATMLLKPLLLLWDDAEVALHPTLAEKTINWLAKLDAQTIIATHSIDLLKAYAKTAPPNSQLIYLDRERDDTITPRIIQPPELEEILRRGLDPRLAPELEPALNL